MQTTIDIEGKPVNIKTSAAADRALNRRGRPLLAEMELYFSCLVRKQVRFHDAGSYDNEVSVGEVLSVRFRPVMTAKCGIDYEGDEPPLADFPIVKTRPYVPNWLRIDYKGGEWVGEFGYKS
jgi:hypothetical protein